MKAVVDQIVEETRDEPTQGGGATLGVKRKREEAERVRTKEPGGSEREKTEAERGLRRALKHNRTHPATDVHELIHFFE